MIIQQRLPGADISLFCLARLNKTGQQSASPHTLTGSGPVAAGEEKKTGILNRSVFSETYKTSDNYH